MDYNRKNQILRILRTQRYASVDELCGQLFVSSATMRRELKALEESQQIQRTRGGAYLLEGVTTEDPYAIRERQNVTEKQMIARQALQYLQDGMTVFLDSSSTVYIMAQMIDHFHTLRIITNSLKTALCLASRHGIHVICAGGKPRPATVSLVGQETVAFLQKYNADAAFLSACGFDLETGTSEASEEESFVKRTYIEHAQKRFLLLDTSKLGKRFLCRTAKIQAFTRIITEDRAVNARLEAAADRLTGEKTPTILQNGIGNQK